MGITNPYYRISRPFTADGEYISNVSDSYLLDSRYADDRNHLIRSYKILERDLIHLFDYVEPHDSNLNVFSHRMYELLLRACTEFEANCKAILLANQYANTNHWNIMDYFKLNQAMKLHEYEIYINIWGPNAKVLRPFATWNSSAFATLAWYQGYNSVKHNRSQNFQDAKLENLINAVASVFILLFAQFNEFTFGTETIPLIDQDQIHYSINGLFGIKSLNWISSEQYDFDWVTLKTTPAPFSLFQF